MFMHFTAYSFFDLVVSIGEIFCLIFLTIVNRSWRKDFGSFPFLPTRSVVASQIAGTQIKQFQNFEL